VSEQRPREVVHWAGVAQPGSLRWLSAALVLSGAMLFAPSCLNPRPDDMPSSLERNPSTRPTLPGSGSMAPTGNNPGIGGDNLFEEPSGEGQVPLEPGVTAPPGSNDPDDPDQPSFPDAGVGGPGIDPLSSDAGPDGG